MTRDYGEPLFVKLFPFIFTSHYFARCRAGSRRASPTTWQLGADGTFWAGTLPTGVIGTSTGRDWHPEAQDGREAEQVRELHYQGQHGTGSAHNGVVKQVTFPIILRFSHTFECLIYGTLVFIAK